MEQTILLADDDELLGSLLNFRVKKTGCLVNHVMNGKEVKEYISHMKPDVIVSDIMMPYFSGIELKNYVKNELSLQTPINSISAGNEKNVLSSFELSAIDFISKPVSPSELLLKIERELYKTKI